MMPLRAAMPSTVMKPDPASLATAHRPLKIRREDAADQRERPA